MTTILYHASPEGAFLATDSLRHNTETRETKFVRKLHTVTSQVLFAGGGISNGVSLLLKALRGAYGDSQGASLIEVAELIAVLIPECHKQGNAERVKLGHSTIPLDVYLAGRDLSGRPQIKNLHQNDSGSISSTFVDCFGCRSVDSGPALVAATQRYRALAAGQQSLSLDKWAIESVEDHAQLFPGQVGVPVDMGTVLSNGSTVVLGNMIHPLLLRSLTVKPLE